MGIAFSATSISGFNKQLDEGLGAIRPSPAGRTYPYLILDARYEKLRENGVIRSRAVLDGHRDRLGGPAPGARRGDGQPREPTELERLPARSERRGLRGVIFPSVTIILGLSGRSWKFSRKLSGNVATCIFCAMRSIICRAKLPTTAWWNYAGSTIGAMPSKPAETRGWKYPKFCV